MTRTMLFAETNICDRRPETEGTNSFVCTVQLQTPLIPGPYVQMDLAYAWLDDTSPHFGLRDKYLLIVPRPELHYQPMLCCSQL